MENKKDSIVICPGAQVIGDVELGEDVSIWHGAVLRGDTDSITIGDNSNVQDNCVVHCTKGFPVEIGKNVSVGHGAVVHGCKLEDNVLVGMNATVLNGARIGKASRGNKVTNGLYGLVATEPAWITANQIEAARIAMTRYIRRGGQVWIKIFPDKPITEKPAETRMGSGKGSPEYWVAVVKPGRVLFEMDGVSEEIAREAMRLAMHKLPIKCKFVTKEQNEAEEE